MNIFHNLFSQIFGSSEGHFIGNSGYAIDIHFKPYEQQHRISSTLYIKTLIKDSLISEGTSPQ